MTKLANELKNVSGDSILGGLTYSFLRIISSILIPIILLPLYAKAFGVELLGVFNLSLTVVNSSLVLGSFGLTVYSLKKCSNEKLSDSEIANLAIDTTKIRVVATQLCIFILCLLGFFTDKFNSDEFISIFILSFTVIGEAISNDWLYIYFKKQKTLFYRGLALKIFTLIGVLLFVHGEDDYLIFLIFYSASNLLICWYFFVNAIEFKTIKWAFFPKISLIRHSKSIFVMTLASSFYGKFDLVLLGYVLSPYDFGLFSAAYRLVQVALVVVTSWAIVLIPYIGVSNKNFNKFFELTFISSFLIFVFIWINAEVIIAFLYGNDFSNSSSYLRTLSFLLPIISCYNYVLYQNKDSLKLKNNIIVFIFICILNALVIAFGTGDNYSMDLLLAVCIMCNTLIFIITMYFSSQKFKFSNCLKLILFVGVSLSIIYLSSFFFLSMSEFNQIIFQFILFGVIFIISIFSFKVINFDEK